MNRHKNTAPAVGRYNVKEFDFDVKEVTDDGKFSGYGSVFGNVDSYKEVVLPGAFKESLRELKKNKRVLPALWQHNTHEPVGGYDVLEEDDTGLHASGFLLINDVQRAREAYALAKARVVTGLSIGYIEIKATDDNKTGIRYLQKLQLKELSLVTFPANDVARIDAVKAKLANNGMLTKRELELALRHLGFSRHDATRIASVAHGGTARDATGNPPIGEIANGLEAVFSSFKF